MSTQTIGDVHLGKAFKNGVPLHRRGDRETMQLAQFKRELANTACAVQVQMGDLFDQMFVPYAVVWAAYNAYREAPAGPQRVVIRGNHDASRDADKVSAFQIFAGLVRTLGVVVVEDEPIRIGDEVFIPWHPFITATEMVDQNADLIRGAAAVYGHWDVVMGDTNQLPAAQLKALGVGKAVTGHDHNRRTMVLEGLTVEVTGSMQPYSHGEDEAGDLYVTVTLDQLEGMDVSEKCVRLIVGPEDEVPVVDCLQLQVQRQKADAVDIGEVDFEAFDLRTLYDQACREVGLSDEFSALALQRLEEERAAAG